METWVLKVHYQNVNGSPQIEIFDYECYRGAWDKMQFIIERGFMLIHGDDYQMWIAPSAILAFEIGMVDVVKVGEPSILTFTNTVEATTGASIDGAGDNLTNFCHSLRMENSILNNSIRAEIIQSEINAMWEGFDDEGTIKED